MQKFSDLIFMKIKCIPFILALMLNSVIAQDMHFSDPFRTPLMINPALTGSMEEDYRVVSAYKNQWASIGAPFQTIYASYDMKILKITENSNQLGAGVSFFNDKAGKTGMGLNQFNINFSYEFQIKETQFISGGLQTGFLQKSINYEGIKWDSQYNGIEYDPSLPTGETYLQQNNSYLDAGAGITWNYVPGKKFFAKVGLAIYHLTMAN